MAVAGPDPAVVGRGQLGWGGVERGVGRGPWSVECLQGGDFIGSSLINHMDLTAERGKYKRVPAKRKLADRETG